MKYNQTFLTLSLIIVAFIIGLTVGYAATPEYQQTMFTKQMSMGKADSLVDLRYLNQMASHHQAAILLADQIVGRSTRPELQKLAADIKANEPDLINKLVGWKRSWYRDYRPIPQPNVVKLGQHDEKLDLRFLNALIAHHQEGITMTKEIKLASSRVDVLNDADAVEQFLQTTLVTLRQWRLEWYNIQ